MPRAVEEAVEEADGARARGATRRALGAVRGSWKAAAEEAAANTRPRTTTAAFVAGILLQVMALVGAGLIVGGGVPMGYLSGAKSESIVPII